jgi:hypothetical protein
MLILDDETRLLLEAIVRKDPGVVRPPDEQVLARAVLAIVEELDRLMRRK